MKPRLYKFQGLWYCRSTACRLTGLGFTKEDAYREGAVRNNINKGA